MNIKKIFIEDCEYQNAQGAIEIKIVLNCHEISNATEFTEMFTNWFESYLENVADLKQ